MTTFLTRTELCKILTRALLKPEGHSRTTNAATWHRWLWVIFLNLLALNCFGTSLSFVGTGSYNVVGNSVVLRADRIQNNEIGGISGTIRLELWAFSSPYPGTTSGYKMASYVVGQLSGGYYYYSISSGSIPFFLPPPGTYYFSLQVREYVGTGADGYITRDWINFSSTRVAGGAFFRDVQIVGLTSWLVSGNTVNMQVERVSNICDLGTTGSLRLDLWATTTPYIAGTIIGYRFGAVSLNPLTGGYVYNNINQIVPYSSPPDGAYYVTMTLSEYHNGSYVIIDYVNYLNFLVVGNPPSPPTGNAATAVTSSGFTANWNSVAGATGYRGDVSTSSSFSSYVSGYQNVDVGNVTSGSVSGLSGGTTYYYRVRAYNTVGTSGNSGTIAVTTLPNPPSPPSANAATSITTSGLMANWSSAVSATGYRLDVSASSSFSSYLGGYQDLDVGNVTSMSISGLSAGTTYYYRLRAYNGSGTSGNSGTISAITVPTAPTADAASSVTSNAFTANWSSATGATGYRLDVSASSSFGSYVSGYQNLDVANILSLNASGLSANTSYYYRVRAYNGSGTSINSSTITLTTTSAPSSPPTLSYARQGNNLVLSWPTNDPAFKLEFATNLPVSIWISNPVFPSIVSGKYTITNNMTNTFLLYRLKK